MIAPIPLRPHHLLCTQGYSGHGYSKAYVAHMNEVTRRLRSDPDVLVRIVFGNDTLCSGCPHASEAAAGTFRGDTEAKVRAFDERTAAFAGIHEGIYRYQDLIHRIDRSMTPEKMDEICGSCSWAKMSECKATAISGRYLL